MISALAVPEVHSKLPGVGASIFSVMSERARLAGAINLSQGFPDFPADAELIQAVHEAMREGHNQYAPTAGLPALRAQIATMALARHGARYDAETEVTVTTGATEALFCALQALVHPGDEVIVFQPCYDSYVPAIRLAGGVPVAVPLSFPTYAPDWARVADAIGPRTRAILLNTPHNPTGATLTPADLHTLVELVRNTGIIVLSDEVYEHMVFDGAAQASAAALPELAARSIVIGSFGKSLHATGWKLGYACAPAALSAELRRVHQFTVFCSSTPMQVGITAYIGAHPQFHEELAAFYQAKRDRFRALMAATRFELLPCAGTYFQLARYGAIRQAPDAEFALQLIEQAGVAAIPVSAFYQDGTDYGVLRFCFAKQDATLEAAAERLAKL